MAQQNRVMAAARRASQVIEHEGPAVEVKAMGGIEGAESRTRETARWRPSLRSPDAAINGIKLMADARGRDMVMNDGITRGAVSTFKDSIVGAQYRLNATPNWRVLAANIAPSFDEKWAEEYQIAVEAQFNLASESTNCWFDAARLNTFTGLVRLAVGGFVFTGEVLATCEWIREVDRPFNTAVQMVSPDRLSNPNGQSDTQTLRRGVRRDGRGRPIGYNFRTSHPGQNFIGDFALNQWTYVPVEKPWGRKQVIHIFEQDQADQSRGIAEMVTVLKQMRMTKQFSEVTLQNAVVNATYAAAIESELPPDVIAAAMGQGATGSSGLMDVYGEYMTGLSAYLEKANGIALDGVKIPHFFPGTKLALKTLGTPGGIGTDYEASLIRHIAAGLNLSYEELSRDYSKTNYSSGRMALNKSGLGMKAKKKFVADRFADNVHLLWLEEYINAGRLPMPRAFQKPGSGVFYAPLAKEAFGACTWIGAGSGQIDELKETQAALLRVAGGLSTRELEAAKLGLDWREVFTQQERETRVAKELGLVFSTNAQRDGSQSGQTVMNQDNQDGGNNNG